LQQNNNVNKIIEFSIKHIDIGNEFGLVYFQRRLFSETIDKYFPKYVIQ